MTDLELKILTVYRDEDIADPEGAFAPYYHTVTAAANGDPDLAYAACKSLKKAGLLSCGNDRQGSKLINAPSYWITDQGKQAFPSAVA